ncbi:hypothetical protein CH252_30900 [Rhodococcus sp. 06-1477-1B]|nr:hypothetical protein CH252_30900 [Rhodococcus sp. 06-1477-1B]
MSATLLSPGLRRVLRKPRFLRGPIAGEHVTARTIRTFRMTLRPYVASDAEDWFALQSEPEVIRHLDWPARDHESSRQHLLDRTRHTRIWQAEDILALAVEYDGKVVGDVTMQLRALAPEVRTVEMGWIIHPHFTGRGFATEASLAMLRIAFDELNAKIVTAVIRTQNNRSLALAERLGFREVDRSQGTVLLTLSRTEFLDNLARVAQVRGLIAPAPSFHRVS